MRLKTLSPCGTSRALAPQRPTDAPPRPEHGSISAGTPQRVRRQGPWPQTPDCRLHSPSRLHLGMPMSTVPACWHLTCHDGCWRVLAAGSWLADAHRFLVQSILYCTTAHESGGDQGRPGRRRRRRRGRGRGRIFHSLSGTYAYHSIMTSTLWQVAYHAQNGPVPTRLRRGTAVFPKAALTQGVPRRPGWKCGSTADASCVLCDGWPQNNGEE